VDGITIRVQRSMWKLIKPENLLRTRLGEAHVVLNSAPFERHDSLSGFRRNCKMLRETEELAGGFNPSRRNRSARFSACANCQPLSEACFVEALDVLPQASELNVTGLRTFSAMLRWQEIHSFPASKWVQNTQFANLNRQRSWSD
jgi:hypothetical protein